MIKSGVDQIYGLFAMIRVEQCGVKKMKLSETK